MSRDQARQNPDFNSVHQVNYLQWCFLHAAPPPVFESFEKAEEIIGETRTQLLMWPKIRKHLETINEWKLALYFRLKNFVYPNELSSRGRAGENCLETHTESKQNRSNSLTEEQPAPPPSQPAVTDTNPLQFSTADKQAYFYGSPEPADNPVVHASCMGNRLSNEDASIDGVLDNADARWFTHEDIKEVLTNTYAALNEEMKTSDAQQSYLAINIQNAFSLEEEVQTQSEGNTATPERKPMDGSVDEETNDDGQKVTPSPSAGIARIDTAPIRSLTQTAGSTLCVSWQIPRADGSVDVYTANVGDSRAVAFIRQENKWEAIMLSDDHAVEHCCRHGDYAGKNVLISQDNCWVTAYNATKWLSVGRAMGDFEIKDLPRHPDIRHFHVKPDQEVYILTGCDGFWHWADQDAQIERQNATFPTLTAIMEEDYRSNDQLNNEFVQKLVARAAGAINVEDNVSVTLAPVRTRTINHGEEAIQSQATMVVSGIADGHAGTAVSHFLEKNFCSELNTQIQNMHNLREAYVACLKEAKSNPNILDYAEITLPIEAKNTPANPEALNQWIQREIALIDEDITNLESTIEAMNQNGNIENDSGGAGDSKGEGGNERQEGTESNGLTAQQQNENMQKSLQFVKRAQPVVNAADEFFRETEKRLMQSREQKKFHDIKPFVSQYSNKDGISSKFVYLQETLHNAQFQETCRMHRNRAKVIIPIIALALLGILPGLIYWAIVANSGKLMPKTERDRKQLEKKVSNVVRLSTS